MKNAFDEGFREEGIAALKADRRAIIDRFARIQSSVSDSAFDAARLRLDNICKVILRYEDDLRLGS